MKDLLTELYINAIQDATDYYLSYCCCSAEEREESEDRNCKHRISVYQKKRLR